MAQQSTSDPSSPPPPSPPPAETTRTTTPTTKLGGALACPQPLRAPTIRFSQYGFVIYHPHVRQLPGNIASHIKDRIRQFRHYAETLTVSLTYQWHVSQEESFLQSVSEYYSLLQGTNTEAGLREHNGMVTLLKKAMSHIAWLEEVRAERTLKDWVRAHPGAQFQPYGKAMTRPRKREVKAWEREVRRVKRENQVRLQSSNISMSFNAIDTQSNSLESV
jgi:hypothetical protein